MKIDPADFNALVAKAMQQAEVAAMRPVIEKELLHYDILYCLDQAGLLNELVFQGGTSLRLCHGGNRFSEDLDFAGGVDFSSARLAEMKTCIEDYIGKRYGLEVTVKEPASLKQEKEYAELRIDKWQINITTAPGQKDMPKQKLSLKWRMCQLTPKKLCLFATTMTFYLMATKTPWCLPKHWTK